VLALLLDENLPRSIAARLRALGFDAAAVVDLQARGAADSEVLRLAVAAGRVLVTRDLDFSDILRFPLGSHCGIVVVRLANDVGVDALVEISSARLEPLLPGHVGGAICSSSPRV
jgi:predicted nuclease of predicted toxin-antitoxin system